MSFALRAPEFVEALEAVLNGGPGRTVLVTQRVPVRIAFDPGQALAKRLAPGMSVVVTVDTAAKAAAPTPQFPEPSEPGHPPAGEPVAERRSS